MISAAVVAGPPGSTTYEDGRRFYDVDGEPYWSVTTALGDIGKDRLKFWAAYLAVDLIFDELPRVTEAIEIKPCGRSYSRCRHEPGERGDCCACQECAACVRRWAAERHLRESARRSDEGSRTHMFPDWWARRNGEHRGYDPDIAPYVQAFLAFVEEYGLTPESFLMTERTGINRFHRYAGTMDAIIRFRARATPAAAKLVARCLGITAEEAVARDATVDLLVDFKTQEKFKTLERPETSFYPEWSLQMAAYRHVLTLRIKGSDDEEPMLPTDGALVVVLHPGFAVPRLVVADGKTFNAFLSYLAGWQWMAEHGSASVALKSFPLLKPEKPKQTTRRRAATTNPPPGENPAA